MASVNDGNINVNIDDNMNNTKEDHLDLGYSFMQWGLRAPGPSVQSSVFFQNNLVPL